MFEHTVRRNEQSTPGRRPTASGPVTASLRVEIWVDIEDIKPLLPLEAAEVDLLWTDWLVSGGSAGPDLDPFVTSLRDAELIDETTWRSLLVGGELHLMSTSGMNIASDLGDGLSDRFLTLGQLGKGAMGEVHLALQRELKRKVAIKRLRPHHATNDRMQERFLREVQVTAQLDHPNIVPIYAVEYDGDEPVAAMKLVQGRTLRDYLKRSLQLTIDNALDAEHSLPRRLDLFLKLCDAMAYAHERGIVHRDLKPDNVMIGDWGEVYVMDWGIARSVREPDQDLHIGAVLEEHGVQEDRTGTWGSEIGAVIGTPRYMSPEQARGAIELDTSSDQYSLGLLLFELVCLKPANPGTSSEEAIDAALNGLVAAPEHKVPGAGVPAELRAIIAKATEALPAERYANVGELGHDVRRYLDGEAVLAKPDTAMQATLRWISRNRAAALALILALVVTALLAVTWSLLRQEQVRAQAAMQQENLGAAVSLVAERAGAIDEEFLRLQGLLRELSGAAHQAVTLAPPGGHDVYLDTMFDDPEQAPADFLWSERYGKKISTEFPVIRLAPGVVREDVQPQIERMAHLRTDFQRVMLASRDEADIFQSTDHRRRTIADDGVPIVWAFFATEQGVHAAFPGKGGYGADYDPRQRPWYRLGAHKAGPQWGNPYVDAQGQGMLLPFTTSVYDDGGELVGVAGMELTFRYVIDSLLDLTDLPGVRETYLVTDTGRIVVRSGAGSDFSESLRDDGSLALKLFPDMSVVDGVLAGQSGHQTVEGELLAWHRMHALGWFYVARADAGVILSGGE
jgi:eukaryotic-like serine/threonine-protein kinase